MRGRVVVSGAPGTGKSTIAALLAEQLDLPLLSLDVIKEALADVLGLGDEAWSNMMGDAAAEVVFRLAGSWEAVIAEGWWRRERRDRAVQEFAGWVEVFCSCAPAVAGGRMRARAARGRHPIHRDVINPSLLDAVPDLVASAEPLRLGAALVEVDTTGAVDPVALVDVVRAALEA